ncbi:MULTISPECIES: aminoglycoside phosphotransferase family protein [unclassified Bacillus (in: firmicutes)]|uniref:aminoglycoside phosphotransferase family protein n=1 Tax=unclassified Bacillus (in: firmicutes) TaxID=185979 RepID=UPI0008EDC178|nr:MULTISPECIES: aminoglycoside phosphotransferase family protein [unclassified Bacillus (in: firmicutes)]SFI81616.1 Predicted kinase, aminoglycoside phosphotransferase (APT) family [Bacillus sp. 71mf]SFS84775.1 Predicted kinase, aminoglycoside phosphotransferase (APT) family [Bacillus sp. 103mf]
MNDVIQTLQERVKLLQNAKKIEGLSKGYSPDKKYVAHLDNEKLLLRVGDIQGYKKKKTEFQILQNIKNLGVKSPQPIDIGMIEEFNSCYNIYSFIDGVDAKDMIQTLTKEDQYKIGIEAGIQLSRMHSYEAPSTINTWYDRAMEKHYRYLNAYKSCGIKIKNDEKIIDFIEENKQHIKKRPNRFQHDDFHLENIIVKDKKFAGVIDFNNFDWGDPLHDFVKVALFQRERSVPFSIGQIEGYFNNNVPEDFWMLYSIYSGMVIFSSVVWSLRFAPEQLEEMIGRLYVILEDHKNFEILKPTWYESSSYLTHTSVSPITSK